MIFLILALTASYRCLTIFSILFAVNKEKETNIYFHCYCKAYLPIPVRSLKLRENQFISRVQTMTFIITWELHKRALVRLHSRNWESDCCIEICTEFQKQRRRWKLIPLHFAEAGSVKTQLKFRKLMVFHFALRDFILNNLNGTVFIRKMVNILCCARVEISEFFLNLKEIRCWMFCVICFGLVTKELLMTYMS